MGLIGCGGMGRRHILGYLKLRMHYNDIELISVCDVYKDVADAAIKPIYESGLNKRKIYSILKI